MRNLKTVNYDEMFTLSAQSPKWVWNAQGQLVEIPAGQPAFGYDRFTGEPLGQIVESVGATNVLLNSFAPATQTVSVSDATTYTLSVYGSGSAEITAGGSGTATDGSPLTFTTAGTSVTVTVTGTLDVFQLEAGSEATSPIKTTGSAVTRTADAVNANTSFAEQYDPAQGWLLFKFDTDTPASYIMAAYRAAAGGSNNDSLQVAPTIIRAFVGREQFNFFVGDLLGGHAVVVAWDNGMVRTFVDGALESTVACQLPIMDSLRFFARGDGASPGNGHLFDFRMGRVISDDDAIARTTL